MGRRGGEKGWEKGWGKEEKGGQNTTLTCGIATLCTVFVTPDFHHILLEKGVETLEVRQCELVQRDSVGLC